MSFSATKIAKRDAQLASISKRFIMANFIFSDRSGRHVPGRRSNLGRNALWLLVFLPLAMASAAFPNFTNLSKDRVQGDALYQQAYAAYRNGDYPLSLRLAEQADKLKPDQADGWNLRGVVLLKQKAYDQAESAFARAAACDPDMWATQFNLAEVPYQRKDYARARSRFEHLLGQTDRYKESRKWEIVLYKTFLSYLFLGDEAGARKKLAKLTAAPGSNPVLVYADAAVAFQRKDAATAQKMIAAAQTKFPQETNDLFTEPLVQAGWIAVLPPGPAPLVAGAGPVPPAGGAAAALGAARGAAGTPGGVYNNHQPVLIDPRLEEAAAEPLPEPDGVVKPMLTKLTSTRAAVPPPPAAPTVVRPLPASTPKVAVSPLSDTHLEHADLLLE